MPASDFELCTGCKTAYFAHVRRHYFAWRVIIIIKYLSFHVLLSLLERYYCVVFESAWIILYLNSEIKVTPKVGLT